MPLQDKLPKHLRTLLNGVNRYAGRVTDLSLRWAVAWSLAVGVVLYLLSPMAAVPGLSMLYNLLCIAVLVVAIVWAFYQSMRMQSYAGLNFYLRYGARFATALAAVLVMFGVGYELLPKVGGIGRAAVTADTFCANVGQSTTMETEKFGNVRLYPLRPTDNRETTSVMVRDVRLLPGLYWQTRSADVATKLAENVDRVVQVSTIYDRRGRGFIPFVNVASFPVAYHVDETAEECK